MTDLTKAQSALLHRLWIEPVRLYGGEWRTFYGLKAKGFARYLASDVGKMNYTYGVITELGRIQIGKSEK